MEKLKLTLEEQNQVQTLKNSMIEYLLELGKSSMDINNTKELLISLENDHKNLISTLNKLNEQETELIKVLGNKYGSTSTIDLKTYEIN